MPHPEPWPQIYRDAPEVFEAFARAEDPEGLVVQRVRDLAGVAGRKVLEIGCGTGRYSRELARASGAYFALEPGARMLGLARQACQGSPVHLVAARGESLPFKAQSMDLILATWVLAYLKPGACAQVLRDARRVLRHEPGAGIWLVENHWTGVFQALRGREGFGGEPGVKRLLEDHGFRVVEVLETELRFSSEREAERVLGALCGPEVRERLRKKPMATVGHHVVILHHPLA